MADFKKLQVWQKAHALAVSVDRVCKRIRGSQYASLRNQLFRSASSIPANIAEGRRQTSEKEFRRFLRIALNSSSELEYHLILARDTKVILESDFVNLVAQTITVRKMLYALIRCIREADPESSKKRGSSRSPQPPAAPPTAASR
ncbi:MAG TPA: four helix bundle protein [Gemmatimonadaceae bacterium]|nr:four helix bundle protein [Gemmatimonadaceae bacterium]